MIEMHRSKAKEAILNGLPIFLSKTYRIVDVLLLPRRTPSTPRPSGGTKRGTPSS